MVHDGYLNRYFFSKDRKKITLASLSPSQLHQSMPQNTQAHSDLFLTFSELLLKASYHECKAYKEWILTSLDEFEPPSSSHPLALALLKCFAHVFRKDITSGLPLKRFIQHHIG